MTMATKKIGKQTLQFERAPYVVGFAAVGGKMEGQGPLKDDFDYLSTDARFSKESWEKAESEMQYKAFTLACDKAKLPQSRVDLIFAGDLLNQCTASTFSLREIGVPFLGLYGACSTMAEGTALAAMSIDGGFADYTAAVTSSHFCAAERQFRTPLEYGVQRCPSTQWTATAAGSLILSSSQPHTTNKCIPRITHATLGRVCDTGVTDVSAMGAAMAVAAYETLYTHFEDSGFSPDSYDLILTGDLGSVGHKIVTDFFGKNGTELKNYTDCGLLLYDREKQDVHSGASGCGCSASVLCGHILRKMVNGELNTVLLAATGALMSPTSSGQHESIPGICHIVRIDNYKL